MATSMPSSLPLAPRPPTSRCPPSPTARPARGARRWRARRRRRCTGRWKAARSGTTSPSPAQATPRTTVALRGGWRPVSTR
ncbi:hypothetical protein G6F31_015651 [Rhizopus arrhizus]|nr:hypothetical protein G6F31_015651 [Rhizopus arrhizus]